MGVQPNPEALPGFSVPIWERTEHGDQLIAGWSRETWDSDHCPKCGEEWKDCAEPGHHVDDEEPDRG